MHQIKISNQKNPFYNKRSSRIFKKYRIILMLTMLAILLALIIVIFSSSSTVIHYVFPALSSLRSNDNRVNILLLGNAGELHDGPYLTDTIMVASIDLKDNKVYFISLPRDFWVDKLKVKLNAVYTVGQSQNIGLRLDKDIVEEILGIPIHYGIRVDFRGFQKAIDQIGGIDIEVERSFDDYYYPIATKENDLCGFREEEKEFSEEEAKKLNIPSGKQKVLIAPDGKIATDSAEPERGFEYFKCRYEHIRFDAGLQHMNGAIALIFVRSRMGTNSEGSDFARSKRQQKVIDATKEKVLSLETLANPKRVSDLLSTFDKSFETDIPVDDIVELYNLSKKLNSQASFVIDNRGKDSLLYNPPLQDFGGAWVLIPKGGDFDIIHDYVKKILAGEVTENEASTSARTSN